jgi:hypothetical protein
VIVLGAAVCAGCAGSGSFAEQEYPSAAEQLVSEADLRVLDPSSPQYAVMDWWRDAQFSDLSGYLDYFTPKILNGLDRQQVERALPILAGGIRIAKPRVLSVELNGNTAVVYSKIVFRQPIGATRYVTTTRPQAFHLARLRQRWRMADTYFVDSITAAALDAQHRAGER